MYSGHWLGGFRHGRGRITYPGGEVFEGEWHYGVPFGAGSFTHADGETFTGAFRKYFMSPKDIFQSGTNLGKWKGLATDGYGKS